jgi:hypothetical protein
LIRNYWRYVLRNFNSLFFVCNLRISGLFFHLPTINNSFLGQAFRCFDWNQTGYIRVRLKFLILLFVSVWECWGLTAAYSGWRHEVDYTQLGDISFPHGSQGENCASVSSQLLP